MNTFNIVITRQITATRQTQSHSSEHIKGTASSPINNTDNATHYAMKNVFGSSTSQSNHLVTFTAHLG